MTFSKDLVQKVAEDKNYHEDMFRAVSFGRNESGALFLIFEKEIFPKAK